ncbi:MAG: hypothetical protein KME59_21435 [Trichormus sp. ATA11-4-KO1]|jgi:hypothetical protein|nr:hypothetical protein [Trichormus sp. ATA11-4-KO1]
MNWLEVREVEPSPGTFVLTRTVISSIPQVAVLVGGTWYAVKDEGEWLCKIDNPELWTQIDD